MINRFALLTATGLLLAGVAPAQAQLLNPTGSGFWDICWQRTEYVSTGGGCGSTGSISSGWYAAPRITADPSGWTDVPTSDGAYYIGALASGSVEPNVRGEDPNYTYTFRTNLGFADYSGLVGVDLTTFFLDNYWVGWSFDGVNFNDAGISPDPLDPTGQNWRTEFQLAAYQNVSNYDGDFYLRITGNGRTDGILAAGTVTVPEPGTYVLLLTGLLGLGLVAFRRRAVAA